MKDEAPIAAATLIVMRDGPTAPELLMVERAAGLRFAGGAVAFPGGRIEPVDYASANHSLDAAKVAAIRETAEETGILIAAEPRPCEQAMFEIGVELRAGRSLSAILAERNVRLAIATLVPFARWCPVGLEKRIFFSPARRRLYRSRSLTARRFRVSSGRVRRLCSTARIRGRRSLCSRPAAMSSDWHISETSLRPAKMPPSVRSAW